MIVQVTAETKEFKKLQQLLQRKCHTKKELCVTLSLLRLCQVGHVVQNSVLSLARHELKGRE